jgi:8-oxo-dGTP pyrophosphatase MutT (NUDIX family)
MMKSKSDNIPVATNHQWHPHLTVASIVERDGKYLMIRETHRGQSVINQPAGHVEKGESLVDAVIRETREETGWNFEPVHISGIYQFVAANGETYVRFTFSGSVTGENKACSLDPVIEEVLWLDKSTIEGYCEQLRSQVVLKCIEDYEAGNRLPLNSVQHL